MLKEWFSLHPPAVGGKYRKLGDTILAGQEIQILLPPSYNEEPPENPSYNPSSLASESLSSSEESILPQALMPSFPSDASQPLPSDASQPLPLDASQPLPSDASQPLQEQSARELQGPKEKERGERFQEKIASALTSLAVLSHLPQVDTFRQKSIRFFEEKECLHSPILLEEREDCLAVYKPIAWASHALSAWDTTKDVSRWLLHQRPNIRGIGEERAPGLLHRLDNPTSGLLLFATSSSRYHQLIQARQQRLWCKLYLARASGQLSSACTLRSPIIHHPTKKKLMQLHNPRLPSSQSSRPQEAITHLVPIDYNAEVDQTLLLLRIETGVRHQIRLHLSSEGLPILGDTLYSGQLASRLYLHAWALSVPSSSQDGEPLLFLSPIPRDFLF